MKYHQYANLFPMLNAAELDRLAEDIKENGQQTPIVTYKGEILDGRNRYEACQKIGADPIFEDYEGSDPLKHVISLNLHRRHLNESQRAMVAANIANMNRGGDRKGDQTANLQFDTTTRAEAAKLLNVSERTVNSAKKVQEKASPEITAAVQGGEISVSDAASIADLPREKQQDALANVQLGHAKNLKAAARQADIEDQRAGIVSGKIKLPDGLFEVISIDPPWPYGDQGSYDPAGNRAPNPYPEMSLDEIAALEIPAADDCVLWLWTTHKFMRHAFPLIDSWGFQERAILTWCKDRMGLGRWLRSQSEFCIMATKGKPTISLTNQTTVLKGPMREHSRKPDEFYALVDSLCVGRKLDFFSREFRENWSQLGNDTGKFAA